MGCNHKCGYCALCSAWELPRPYVACEAVSTLNHAWAMSLACIARSQASYYWLCAALQAYRNPQGPGNAVEGAAAVYAHESQEAGAMPAMVMPAAVGTPQSTAEQAGPDLGMPAVRVV